MNQNPEAARAYQRAIGLGIVTGLRSLSAPALLSRAANHDDLGLRDTPFAFLETRQAELALSLLATTELIGDKLPGMPARTSPFALTGRITLGALVGAAAFSAEDEPVAVGAVVGAVAAVAATFGAYYLRKAASEKGKVSNVVAGLIEDSIVAAAGWGVLAATRR
jgi:uncharacterized membrane protein